MQTTLQPKFDALSSELRELKQTLVQQQENQYLNALEEVKNKFSKHLNEFSSDDVIREIVEKSVNENLQNKKDDKISSGSRASPNKIKN